MNLTYLRSFYTTVKCNSISRAAKQLHMTQPGVSIQIQKLENEMNSKLLNRSNTGVSLTEAGKIIFEFSESMLSLEDNLEKKLTELKNIKSKLAISCCKSLGEHVIPCSIYTFKEIHCNIDISMDIDNTSDILKKLSNHETNIGIIQGEPNNSENFEIIPLLSDNLILVGGKNNDIKSISINELYNLPLIVRENGSANKSILKESMKNNSINFNNLNIVLSLNSPQSIKSSISFGHGYSFLPEVSLTHELRSGVFKKINVNNIKFPFEYYIVFRKNYILAPYEEKFIDFLTSKKRCFCY
ncbi:LysR family transcriptional regulator [Clostridium sp. D53t1_180928_C8]|uniref:LysR family transcriptional regulator n=1 Tax=Clostridium sp. D53t1_180928_C8 TaxID=2787101 RepID=UPI0018AA6A77|nr:LysR family transcriptional regulator [Clostridium sp. D53t1_180928_C8]